MVKNKFNGIVIIGKVDYMINIAICDDEELFCLKLKEILDKYRLKTGIKMNIEIFFSGEAFCDRVLEDEACYNLVFLDIEMGEFNGIKVGRFIRNDRDDDAAQIVYVSSKQEYAMELFRNRPLNFLVKPVDEHEVIECVEQTIKLMGRQKLFYEFNNGRALVRIALNDILYLESNNRKVRIITKMGSYAAYDKLSSFVEKYGEKGFIQVHKSYVINYQYVSKISYDKVILSDDTEINITRSFRDAVRAKLLIVKEE